MLCVDKLKKWILVGIILLATMVISVIAQADTSKSSSALMSLVKSFGDKGAQEQQPSQQPSQIAVQPVQQLSLTPVQTSQKTNQYDPHGVFTSSAPFEEEAFQNVSRQALPMTPEQIVRLKQMLAETQRASSTPADTPPKPISTTQMVDLAPGSVPTPIRMQQGFITSIVFVDNTGAPWPIESCNIGNPKAFNLLPWQPGSNTIMIQALSMYTYGNIAVKLQNLATPVMLTLVPGQKVVDYRVDLRVQQAGPNSQETSESDMLPSGAKDVLLGVLDGVPPDGAQPLEVLGGDCQAWALGNKMYLRTRFTILSPSWIAVMTSSDGTKAYEMTRSSDVLVSRYGKTVNLRIRER